MFGAAPAALTYYWRMKMPETARYTALVAKNARKAAADMSKVLQVDIEAEETKVEKLAMEPANSFGLFSRQFARRHGLHLLGTTSTWFLLDIAFYSQNLFQKDIFSAIGWIPKAETMNAIHEVCYSTDGFLLHDRVHVCACYSLPSLDFSAQPNRVRRNVLIDLLLCKFWTQCNHLCSASRDFPSKAKINLPWYICSIWEGWCHNWGVWLPVCFPKPRQNSDGCRLPTWYWNEKFAHCAWSNHFLGMLFTFLVPEPKGKSLEEMTGENEDDSPELDMQPPTNRTVPV
ncbi:putative inorganic phosphate transporter 1-3 [Vitis vinifera]|uniref:Putative inorganic phosphate transporter 1-3 n=1 Tax=Vitis vinifera TaxID=29760 RepID=A0A438HQT6_VITVI|nr:putative inorganic phosphate transporter 1-3 [Vitis vinifera]